MLSLKCFYSLYNQKDLMTSQYYWIATFMLASQFHVVLNKRPCLLWIWLSGDRRFWTQLKPRRCCKTLCDIDFLSFPPAYCISNTIHHCFHMSFWYTFGVTTIQYFKFVPLKLLHKQVITCVIVHMLYHVCVLHLYFSCDCWFKSVSLRTLWFVYEHHYNNI